MKFIVAVIAVVFIVEGIPYLAAPSKVKRWSMTIQEVPNKYLRMIGLSCMVLGLIALYLIRAI